MTISITRCPNSEFLLKFHDGERTVMTWVLTKPETAMRTLLMDEHSKPVPHWVFAGNIYIPVSRFSDQKDAEHEARRLVRGIPAR